MSPTPSSCGTRGADMLVWLGGQVKLLRTRTSNVSRIHLHPGGMSDNSPTFRTLGVWDWGAQVPKGRLNQDELSAVP